MTAQKGFMGPGFFNFTMVHHNNHVRIPYCRKTMGNDEGGSPLHQFTHGILNLLFCAGINTGCCLIQNQNIRIAEEGTANCQQLTLALRKTGAGFRQNGMIAVGQVGNNLSGTGNANCLLECFFRNIRIGIGEICKKGRAYVKLLLSLFFCNHLRHEEQAII